jgi:hypothetical protein
MKNKPASPLSLIHPTFADSIFRSALLCRLPSFRSGLLGNLATLIQQAVMTSLVF